MRFNHCLRATATTVLSHAGFDGNEICAVRGHRSVDSLKNYAAGPSMDQRNKMSTVLHNYGSSFTDGQADCSLENAGVASTSSQAITHTMPQFHKVWVCIRTRIRRPLWNICFLVTIFTAQLIFTWTISIMCGRHVIWVYFVYNVCW